MVSAAEVFNRTLEHLQLVGMALAVALVLGIPLGLVIARRPRVAAVVLAVANALQTIPSLALFGVLLTVPLLGGIGPAPAVVALSLYALLPLIRTTCTGLQQVDAGLREAGRALGLSPRQVLFSIELPLAAPVILTGVRLAAVGSVALAAVAAAIGAGGLGVFIYRGIATVNHGLILAGALPAAGLALLVDGALGLWIRRPRRPRRPRPPGPRRRRWRLGALGGLVLLLTGLLLAPRLAGLSTAPAVVRIGSKSFTEQVLLGELLAQQIEAHTALKVERRFDLGGTFVLHDALRAGQLDGYVEYTGTAWTAILHRTPRADAQLVWRQTAQAYRSLGLRVFPSLGFDNTFAMLVRGSEARRHQLKTISDAVPLAPHWRAGFGFEFLNRADGWPGLARTYGLRLAAPPREMDLGLTYRALAQGQVDLIAGNATDGQIAALDLQQLADDRHYFPPYQAVPVFNSASLGRHPALVAAVEALAGRVSAEQMRELNREVDLEHRDPAEVVRRFRQTQAL